MPPVIDNCRVGIYKHCTYRATIFTDRIVVTSPYVRVTGNTGVYETRKGQITDPQVLASLRDVHTQAAEEITWGKICAALGEEYWAWCGQF